MLDDGINESPRPLLGLAFQNWEAYPSESLRLGENIIRRAEVRGEWDVSAFGALFAAIGRIHLNLHAASVALFNRTITDCHAGHRVGMALSGTAREAARLRQLAQQRPPGTHWRREFLLAIHQAAIETDCPEIEGRTALELGTILRDQGQWERAVAYLDRAYEISLARNDWTVQAVSLQKMASLRHLRGDWRAAKRLHGRAADLFRRAGNPEGLFELRVQETRLMREEGLLDEAVQYLKEAMKAYPTRVATLRAVEARAEMGSLYREQGDLARALRQLTYVVQWYERKRFPGHYAAAQLELEQVYALLGQFDEREVCCAEAEKAVRRAGYPLGISQVLVHRARLARDLGQSEKAIEYLKAAQEGFERLPAPERAMRAALDRIDIYLRDKRLSEADAAITEAQRGIPSLQNPLLEQRLQIRRGEWHAARGEWQQAHTLFIAVLRKSKTQGYLPEALRLQSNLGAACRYLGRLQEAEAFFAEAIRQLESVRASLPDVVSFQIRFGATLHTYLEPYLDMLTRQGRFAEAFYLVQRIKARALIDRMDGVRASVPSRRPGPQQLEIAANQQAKADRANAQLVALLASGLPETAPQIQEARRAIIQAERNLARTISRYNVTPGVRRPPGGAAGFAGGSDLSLAPGDVLLEFIERGTTMQVLMASRPGAKEPIRFGSYVVPRAALRADIQELESACVKPRPWRESAARLGTLLFGKQSLPSEEWRTLVRNAKRFLVCPSAEVWRLPFAALLLPGDPLPMGHTREIIYNYSRGVFTRSQERARRTATRTEAALIVANSAAAPRANAGGGDPLYQALIQKLGPLRYAEREAQTIQQMIPGSLVLKDDAATRTRIRDHASRFRYIHFATHALLNDYAPLHSALLIAPSREDEQDTPLLAARDMTTWDLGGADLMTLSACHSGQGKTETGEGLIGFAWAALSAGCSNLVGACWEISDFGATEWMTRFYQSVRAGKSFAAALRYAVATTHGQARSLHPHYWAAFRLFGVPEAAPPPGDSRPGE